MITVRLPELDIDRIMPPYRVYHAEPITNRTHIYQVLSRLVGRSDRLAAALASDELLPLLSMFDNDELDYLVKYLDAPIVDTRFVTFQGGKRIEGHKLAVNYWPDHQHYVQLIDEQLRLCGGNEIANKLRGSGPTYREIVADVCGKCKVTVPEAANVPEMERLLVGKLFEDARARMSSKEWEEVAANLNAEMKKRGYGTPINPSLSAPVVTGAAMLSVQASGFLAYQYSVVIANAIAQRLLGHGLAFATNAVLTRSIGIFAGPIGWVITALLTGLALAGPAYRITMPCVAHIANCRLERLGG